MIKAYGKTCAVFAQGEVVKGKSHKCLLYIIIVSLICWYGSAQQHNCGGNFNHTVMKHLIKIKAFMTDGG